MNILLVDDHALVRAELRRLLAGLPAETAECGTGEEALTAVQARAPDLVVLGLNLPGLVVLVLSMHAEPLYAAHALEAGARGYISKNTVPEELLTAVRRVVRGGRYVEAELAQELAAQPAAQGNPLAALSERELEILRLLARGRSLAEIGEGLSVSYKTVANTCSVIKAKLGVVRTADLLRLAIGLGLAG